MDARIIKLFQPPHDHLLFETFANAIAAALQEFRDVLLVNPLFEANTRGFKTAEVEVRVTSQQVGGVYINIQVMSGTVQAEAFAYEIISFAGLHDLVKRYMDDRHFSTVLVGMADNSAVMLFTHILLALHRRYAGPLEGAPQLPQYGHRAGSITEFPAKK